jgi:hypothetical protein
VWVELSKDVVELAAAMRVRHGLRTPDALQAASCLQLGEEHLFLTGDAAFQRVAGLHVRVLAGSSTGRASPRKPQCSLCSPTKLCRELAMPTFSSMVNP